MGLQIRLRHALGERFLELPDRPMDAPLVVGRASEANLRIPSISVAAEQLVLFVHEGRWLAQDTPGATGSLLNGQRLNGAKVLANKDVLTLGPGANPPTIEIESVGRAVQTVEETSSLSARATFPTDDPPVMEVETFEPQAPAQTPEYEENPAAVAGEGDWTIPTPPQADRRPKRQKSADGAIAFVMISIIATVAGTGYYVYTHRQPASTSPLPVAIDPPMKPRPRVIQPSSRPELRTVFNEQPAATQPVLPDITDESPPTTGSSAVAAKPASQPVKMFPDAPDAEAVKAFKAVESVYYNPDPAKALMVFDAYAKANPGMNATLLAKYQADMLDKIWWERIDGLFEKQKELSVAVRKTEQDIKDETEAAYKKTVLQPRLVEQKKRLAAAGLKITKEMAYNSPTPPPIGKDIEISDLRDKRDAKIYADWCKRVLAFILSHQGAYPWANEK